MHWHGVALANAADGVPDMTRDAIGPGDSFLYEVTPPDAGTFLRRPRAPTTRRRG